MIDPTYLLEFAAIALINIALSSDNVIVIGMAAASLPPGQRRVAIIGGGVLAIVLRIGLTLIATALLKIPLLPVIGGLTLLWVAWRLLKADTEADTVVASSDGGVRRAIQLIVIADLTMSIDNVLAVAATAAGDTSLVIAEIIISMPLLLLAGGAVSVLIDRFRGLIYLGAAVITFTGVRMVLEAEPLSSTLGLSAAVTTVICVVVAVALPVAFRLRNDPSPDARPEPGA